MTDGAARWVMHIDMDAFFASVEQLTRPTLSGRPVLVGGVGGRGVVAGASYEARVYGARSAMPMHEARRLIGAQAVVIPPRGSVYRTVSAAVFSIIRAHIPVVETLSFDEAFGEPEALIGASADEAVAYAHALRLQIRNELGLAASIGLGGGKQVAKISSAMAKPDGVLAVPPGTEEKFLRPLPVRKLWGVGPVAGERLHRLGIETIGQFADLDAKEVSSVLGSTLGPALHQLAHGIDDRPIAERVSAKQISAESTFPHDITTMLAMRTAIEHAATSAHRRLLEDGRGARTVVLKMKRSDMSVLTRSLTFAPATVNRGELIAAAQKLAIDPVEIGPIRLVGVGYSGLTAEHQYPLFTESLHEPETAVVADALSQVVTDVAPDNGRRAEALTPPREAMELAGGVQRGGGRSVADDGSITWATGTDVHHRDHGHGWVQGSGHGVVSVRFETRITGPGRTHTFPVGDDSLNVANPLVSLDWPVESWK